MNWRSLSKLCLTVGLIWLSALLPMADASAASLSDAAFGSNAHTQADLVAEVSAVAPGQTFWVAVRMKMDPAWHIYWVNYGDIGIPTTIQWELPPGWTAGSIQWPTPKQLPIDKYVEYGYEGTALLLVQITPPANLPGGTTVNLKAKLDWLECTGSTCVPGKGEVSLSLPVADKPVPDTTTQPLLEQARANLPQASTQFNTSAWRQKDKLFLALEQKPEAKTSVEIKDAYFFSEDSQTKPASPQILHHTAHGWVLEMDRIDSAPADAKTLPGILTIDGSPTALAIAPTLAAASPADFADFNASADNAVSFGSLLGILGLGFLGGLILNIMPCVFPVLGIKVLGFVKQSGAERGKVVRHGLVFTAGVLLSMWTLVAVLQSLRSAGEQLGWGFQLQEPRFVLGLAIFFLLFALSLSGVFEIGGSLIGVGANLTGREGLGGSFFQGVLAVVVATPCTAPLLAPALSAAFTLPPVEAYLTFTAIALGLASPYLALSFFPGLARMLPRPGAWMETFKQFMAFPLYATVGFLVYTLAGQVIAERFLNILFALVLIALAAWFYGRYATPAASPLRRNIGKIGGLLLLIVGLVWAYWPIQDLHWEPWSAERIKDLQKEGRPIYVDFTARWCATCQVNKDIVFHSTRVLDELQHDHVALLRADWTSNDPAITAELARFGRSAVPFDLIYLPGHTDPIILPPTLTPGKVMDAFEGKTTATP